MSAILIISILLVFAASFAIIRKRRHTSDGEAPRLPEGVSPRGLFDIPDGDDAHSPLETPEELRAAELRRRAAAGDLGALGGARETGDAPLYRSVLGALVARAAGDADALRALSSYVARGEGLRSSPELAGMLLAEWRRAPAPGSTAELLRVSALSDDAGAFGRAVAEVLQLWEAGRLPGVGARSLSSLFEAEYWLLSPESRAGGAGFVLKQKLADARRRIAARARGAQTTTTTTAQGSAAEAPAQKERP
ncbi:MAG TPA: hypothetical protein VF668_11695 [Pyrinomonadaceae bacterium]